MTVTITLKGALLTVIAVLAIILLIYLIFLIKKLIGTLKKVDGILDDGKVVTTVVAEKTEKLDGIVDGLSDTVDTMVKALKGNKNVVSAATSVVNALSNVAGQIKKQKAKEKK